MINLRVFKNNHIEDATTLEAESEVTTLPVKYLIDGQPSMVWRSDGATTCYIRGIMSDYVYASGIWWVNSNFTINATIKVELWNVNNWTDAPDYTETFSAWEAVYGLGEGPCGEYGYGGYLSSSELPDHPCNVRFFTLGSQRFRRWKVTITDITNSDGYLQCGEMGLGEVVEPIVNMTWGYRISEIDYSTKSRVGAATFGRRGDRVRLVEFQFKELTDIEALLEFRNLAKSFGVTGKTVVCLEPDTEVGRVVKSVYGTFNEPRLRYQHVWLDRWESNYTFLEAA